MGVGLRPGAKAPEAPPTPYRPRASPRLYTNLVGTLQGVGSTLRRSNGRTRDGSFLTEEPRVFGSRLSGVLPFKGGHLCGG